MEALSLIIDKAAKGGYISEYIFKVRDNTVKQITHLLFANDTLVFCKDSEEHMTHLCWILAWFEALSSLNINLEKSSLLPMDKVDEVKRLAFELGCNIGSLPTEYLGQPLEQSIRRLECGMGWKKGFVEGWLFGKGNISTRVEDSLIRSVISNMPTYLLSLFRLLKGVKLRLDKIQ